MIHLLPFQMYLFNWPLDLTGQPIEILERQHHIVIGHINALVDLQKFDMAIKKGHIMAIHAVVPFRKVLKFLKERWPGIPLIDPTIVSYEQQL